MYGSHVSSAHVCWSVSMLGMHMHTHGWQRPVSDAFPQVAVILSLWHPISHWDLELTRYPGVAAIKSQESPCLCLLLPSTEIRGVCHHARFLCTCWGSSSRPHPSKHFTGGYHLPSPRKYILMLFGLYRHRILTSSIRSSDSASDFPGKRILMSLRTNKVWLVRSSSCSFVFNCRKDSFLNLKEYRYVEGVLLHCASII